MKKLYFIFVYLILYSSCFSLEWFTGKVTKVLDGDTIEVIVSTPLPSFLASKRIKVRYIGIDTPELDASKSDSWAVEATEFNRKMVENKTIWLGVNPNKLFDRYNRVLAYVYTDGILLNALFLENGLANYVPLDVEPQFVNLFEKLYFKAIREKLGMWGAKKTKEKK